MIYEDIFSVPFSVRVCVCVGVCVRVCVCVCVETKHTVYAKLQLNRLLSEKAGVNESMSDSYVFSKRRDSLR